MKLLNYGKKLPKSGKLLLYLRQNIYINNVYG